MLTKRTKMVKNEMVRDMGHVFAKFGLTSVDALPEKAFYGRTADDQHPRHVSDYTVTVDLKTETPIFHGHPLVPPGTVIASFAVRR